MISLLFVVLFGLVYLGYRNNTYLILFIAAVANVLMLPFYLETYPLIVGAVDLAVVLAILIYGDKHVWWQYTLLLMALITHYLLISDLETGSIIVSNNYVKAIDLITVLQLLGGVYGILERIRSVHSFRGLYSFRGLSSNSSNRVLCQKKSS